jgi:hypothetical protein
MDEWSKDQRIDAIIRAHGMDPDTFYKAQAWMRAPRPTWADNPDYNEALRTTTGDNGHA